MWAFTKRNLILFFSSGSNLFFSIMGALISFILYLIFLKNNLLISFPFKISSQLLDPWVISGTLTVTAITTTLHALSQMVIDRESGKLADFTMTGVPYWQLIASYLSFAFGVGVIMQILMAGIMFAYFVVVDHLIIPWSVGLGFLGMMILSSLVWTMFNLLCLSFVRQVKTLGQLGSIFGAASGFFAGVYMPIGILPNSAQFMTKLTPAPYNAAIFRQILMKKTLSTELHHLSENQRLHFENQMGIQLNWSTRLSTPQLVLILIVFFLSFMVASLLLMARSRRASIRRV